MGDYNRYVDEMTKQNGYTSLELSSKSIVESRELIMNNVVQKFINDKKEKLLISAQKLYFRNKFNFYLLLSGEATSPGSFYFKFSNKGIVLDEDGLMDLYYDLLYQYYKELLMGYNADRSSNAITVSPVVEMKKQDMEFLNECVEKFNGMKSPKFPEMILSANWGN